MFSRDRFKFNPAQSPAPNSNAGGSNFRTPYQPSPMAAQNTILANNRQGQGQYPVQNTTGYNSRTPHYELSVMGGPNPAQNNNIHIPGHNDNSFYGPSTSRAQFQGFQNVGGSTNTKGPSEYQAQGASTSTSSASQLGLMTMPKSNRYSDSQKSSTSTANVKNDHSRQNVTDDLKLRKSGERAAEKITILTGTVGRIIKYGKIFQNQFCLFQVFGSVVSIADGKVQFEKTMLLRDKKGPILQLTYYSNATHINIEDFHLGQNLRAVGRMVGPNIMSALSIRAATDEEIEILPRLCYISDYAVSTFCGDLKLK